MVTEPTTRLLTVEEFEALAGEANRCELIDGMLRPMRYGGFGHGYVAIELALPLSTFVKERGLGAIVVEVGFVVGRDPGQVLVPDVAFVRSDHVPAPGLAHRIVQVPPDLAVEIRSPSDRPGEVDDKVRRYLAAGVPLVWVIDPLRRTAAVHRPGRRPRLLDATGELDGEDVLPGFRLPLAGLFGPSQPAAGGSVG